MTGLHLTSGSPRAWLPALPGLWGSCGQQSPWHYDALGPLLVVTSKALPDLSLDSGALFFFPFRPGIHLFGSLTRRNPSQVALVPSELGTKVGGVTEQARHRGSSALLCLSPLPGWCYSGLGEDMVLLGVFTTARGLYSKQVSYLVCFPRSSTPCWALAPTYFASPCIPFSGLWVSSCC